MLSPVKGRPNIPLQVASGKKVRTMYTRVGGNDAFDLLVATETASNTYCIYVRIGQCIAVGMGGVFRRWCLS